MDGPDAQALFALKQKEMLSAAKASPVEQQSRSLGV